MHSATQHDRARPSVCQHSESAVHADSTRAEVTTSALASNLQARIQIRTTLPSTQFAEYLSHGTGLLNTVALRVLDAELAQLLDDQVVFSVLGNGTDAEIPSKTDDPSHHRGGLMVGQDIRDETAVDLDTVEGQVGQILERVRAGAKVIERETAADGAQFPNEFQRFGETEHGNRLSNLKHDQRRWQA